MTNKEKEYYKELIIEIAEKYIDDVNWYCDGAYIVSDEGHIINVCDYIPIYRQLNKRSLVKYVHELIDEQILEGEVN